MKIILTFLSIYCAVFFKMPSVQEVFTPSVFLGPDSTIINKYGAVTNICDNGILELADASGFRVGEKVLIYQAQGAIIDSSNTANFGKIIDYANAGNYEMNFISAINGNTIRLRDTLLRGYNVAGKVQIVNIPIYETLTANSLTCKSWNGSTGGILIFEANHLVLTGNIDVSGRGFRGGTFLNTQSPCNAVDYIYPLKSAYGAPKGEGIATMSSNYSHGRGGIANGGGGGNASNAGGAGGSNGGEGGTGGNQIVGCANTGATGGIGGRALSYSTNKIFMGGGGGAGHGNNNSGTSGGNGGGIIIITTPKITGNNLSIKSNGIKAIDGKVTPSTDGQGGGGAGGSIFLNTPQNNIAIMLELNGGNGATVSRNGDGVHGPGGGGGGGTLLLQNTTSTTFASHSLLGGKNGIYVNSGSAHGASGGQNGRTINGITIPQSNVPYKILAIDSILKTPLCDGSENIEIKTSGSQSPFEFSINNGQNWQKDNVFKQLKAGTYNLKIRKNSCISKDTIISLSPFKSDTSTRDSVVCYPSVSRVLKYVFKKKTGCDSVVYVTTKVSYPDTVRIQSITCNKILAGIDTVRLKNRKGCDSLIIRQNIYAGSDTTVYFSFCKGDNSKERAYSKTGVYKEIYKNSRGCDSIVNLNVTILDTAITRLEHWICKGDSIKIGSIYLKNAGIYKEVLQNSLKCDSSIIHTIRFDTRCNNCEPFIPNSFSPNGDGNNDIFEVPTPNATISEMVIYNRWGNLVYRQTGDTPQWDGTFQGKAADEGIYIYMIRATCKTGRTTVWKGDINLVR